MTKTEKQKPKVQEFAAERGMVFREFAGRCLLRGLSYDTAVDVWHDKPKVRGYNHTTKTVVAKILHRPVSEVFADQPPA